MHSNCTGSTNADVQHQTGLSHSIPLTGCRHDGRHASHTVDTRPFQVHDQALEQACTSCCHKTLEDVPGCQPTDHVSLKPQIQFAQDEATHVFYVHRFMTSVARYVR